MTLENNHESVDQYFEPSEQLLPNERLLVDVRLVAEEYGELEHLRFWLNQHPVLSLEFIHEG
jgi:hypothetical protein